MRIKNSISNVLSISFIALLFLFAFTWIIFDFNGSSSSLKDTWSIISSIFGGISTLTAAYIASLLFNDWKDQHNKAVDKEIIFGVIERLNRYLYETQIFHTNIIIFFESIKISGYVFTPSNMLDFKDSLRDIIVNFENSKRHTIANYSDLEAVMSEIDYQEFNEQCTCVCEAADEYTADLDIILNRFLFERLSPDELKTIIDQRIKAYEYIVTSNGGIIDRIKSIKKQLSVFYRAN